jgi:hypothetical protein
MATALLAQPFVSKRTDPSICRELLLSLVGLLDKEVQQEGIRREHGKKVEEIMQNSPFAIFSIFGELGYVLNERFERMIP